MPRLLYQVTHASVARQSAHSLYAVVLPTNVQLLVLQFYEDDPNPWLKPNLDSTFPSQGGVPVPFPRVLGIEAVGLVEEAPSGESSKVSRHLLLSPVLFVPSTWILESSRGRVVLALVIETLQQLQGDVVATAMGGMGMRYDGGYAEYTCVQVQVIASAIKPLTSV
jgi:hypothetical protein